MKKNKTDFITVLAGLVILVVMLGMVFLSLNGTFNIKYKGDVYPSYEVEEIIEDVLEAENPDLDLEVTIIEEHKEED